MKSLKDLETVTFALPRDDAITCVTTQNC